MTLFASRHAELLQDFRAAVNWTLVNAVDQDDIKPSSIMPLEQEEEEEKKLGNVEREEQRPNLVATIMAAHSSRSGDICPHFLKGRCRYKSKCKLQHSATSCPYCHQELPTGKISASTHLARCYKANMSLISESEYEQKL
eukprot:TRINITY_DN60201_c0_g1_i1.p2 TRINITY_DN60201_c0_g1~~TRINITY_DN60201_c0_g1_i1.p2  ORF type:complete len:140 (+),score=32.78 TRINITY_DN60201_c0_g1_i1:783-1202(+)